MASAELQSDLDALTKKIDAALVFPGNREVNDGATKESDPDVSNSYNVFLENFVQIRNNYMDEIRTDHFKFEHCDKNISDYFPSYERINKSKVLDDEKLYEAILYAMIFEDEFEFARHRDACRGQMVWVEMDWEPADGCPYRSTALISRNKIIYEIDREIIDSIRADLWYSWRVVTREVRKNLFKAFGLGAPVSAGNFNEYVSDLQCSFDAAVSAGASSGEHQKVATMTDEMKNVVLDELRSLNLDPRLSQQFEFDLKLLTDKDVYYWHSRLESLRCVSNGAAIGSPQSAEFEQLSQRVAELEKVTASSRNGIQQNTPTKLIPSRQFL